MTIKIDSNGTSVFPAVEGIDVRDAGREVEGDKGRGSACPGDHPVGLRKG